MKGIQFVVDSSGKRIAVQLDLARHGELWEDIYDQITAKERRREKGEPLAAVKKRLISQGKLRG
jgi:hypothetical protein